MNRYLEPFESELIAGTEMRDGREIPDEAAMRIAWLTQSYLRVLASADGGWSTLFRDPSDGRLWEKTYPQGNLHGGGLPVLRYRARRSDSALRRGLDRLNVGVRPDSAR